MHLCREMAVAEVYDLSLAAYLLNPLKDSYFYDDLARDYLSLILPGEKESDKAVQWKAQDRPFSLPLLP